MVNKIKSLPTSTNLEVCIRREQSLEGDTPSPSWAFLLKRLGGMGRGGKVAGKGTLSLLHTELSELLKCEYVSMLFGDL